MILNKIMVDGIPASLPIKDNFTIIIFSKNGINEMRKFEISAGSLVKENGADYLILKGEVSKSGYFTTH